jgi:hypothetical protein
MPFCIPRYVWDEEYLSDKDILVRRKYGSIHGTGDDSDVSIGPEAIYCTINQRKKETLKRAYLCPGRVSLGMWFSTPDHKGILVEEIPLPEPFDWTENIRPYKEVIANLEDCNIRERVREEFGIEFRL